MTHSNKIQPVAYNLAWRLRDVASVAGALTGAFAISSIAFAKLQSFFSSDVAAYVVTGLVCAVVLFVIDFGLRTFFPALLDSGRVLRGNGWKGPVFIVIMLCVVVFQVVSTTSLSWNSASDVTDAVYKEPEKEDVAGLYSGLSKQMQDKVDKLEARVKELEKNIRDTEKQVERSNTKLTALAKDGNGWAQGKLSKMKAASTKSMQLELTQTHSLITQTLTKDQEMVETVVAQAAQENEKKTQRYEEVRARNVNYVGYFGVSCTILFLLLSILLHVWPEEETAPEPKRNGPSIPDGLMPISDRGTDKDAARLASVLSRLEHTLSQPTQVQTQQPETVVAQEKHTHTTQLLDVENLKKATRMQWLRATTSKREDARNENAVKAKAGIAELRKLGYTVDAKEGEPLKIYVA